MGKYIDTSVFNKGEIYEKIPLTLYICMLIKATHVLEINYTQFICAHWLFMAINGYNIGNNVSNNSGGLL